MFVVFALVVTPIGLLRRVLGKDSLRLARVPSRRRVGDGGEKPHLHRRATWRNPTSAMEFLKDLWGFLSQRKKLWLLPAILVLLVFGALIVLTGGTAIAPFIYTLF